MDFWVVGWRDAGGAAELTEPDRNVGGIGTFEGAFAGLGAGLVEDSPVTPKIDPKSPPELEDPWVVAIAITCVYPNF